MYRLDTDQPFGHSFLYTLDYIDSVQLFYCPSWDHPYMQIDKTNEAGNFGG